MVNLPHEIWLHISQYIPASVLEGLVSVNSTFYDIAMDCRYRQISFAFLDNRMLRNLQRLKDPVVARRVRVLHVYPVFLKQVLDREPNLPGRQSLRLRLTAFATHILEQKKSSGRTKFRMLQLPKFRTAEDIVHAMHDVFSGLPNVTDYHIMWCGLQTVPESPVPFLAAILRPKLRKLSLDISLENIVKLLSPPSCTSCNIEELNLVIRTDHVVATSDHVQIMSDYLAPALMRLRNTLRTLTIQAWEPLDFSPLFLALGRLPWLNHLTLGIPIEAPHLGNPSGLTTFLNRQGSTLLSLSLRATQYSGPGLTPDPLSIDGWVSRALTDVHMTHLRSLDISSSLFPFTASLVCLFQFSATITSLVLTGCYHTLADVAAILDAFRDRPRDERLETLRLGSVALTPQLLDLLAGELPNLYRLELLVREVTAHSDEYLLAVHGPPDSEIVRPPCHVLSMLVPDFLLTQDYFFYEMEKRRYPQWHLQRLKILLTSFPYRFPYGPHVEQLLAVCVPTIRDFS
ncbi:hypothetical protein DXG03_003359 [Asterophora parasitica]|uniref:F-box domain-containing protein n=1 Tax=Asterophora parasitica TaxID=117018 RepID=A0A9P7G7M4_9AGAR|nr:hypothetical protein DXG03_003359 [Asterophora parasitica]